MIKLVAIEQRPQPAGWMWMGAFKLRYSGYPNAIPALTRVGKSAHTLHQGEYQGHHEEDHADPHR